MHFLRYASLLAAAALLATSSDVSASTVCVTAKGGKRGTRTHKLPAKTVTVYDVIHPTARVTRVVKAAPKTSTTVSPKIVTVTKTAKADTDVVVTTSTSFKVFVPKKTVEAPTVTPAAVTATFLASNTNTVTTTVTSYNAEPPAPTIAANLVRREDEEDEEHDDELGVIHARDAVTPVLDARGDSASSCTKPKTAAALKKHRTTGKDVYCHSVVKKHVKSSGSPVTITATRNVYPDSWIATSYITFTSTKTVYPREVTSTLTVSKKATITAATQTITVTPTVAPPTTTVTVQAPKPTERVVTNLLSTCDPKKRIQLTSFSALYADTLNIGVGIVKDADSCCSAIGNIPGAVGWAYAQSGTNFVRGECFGALLYSADLCTLDYPGTTLKAVAGSDEVGGLLQCGAAVSWEQA